MALYTENMKETAARLDDTSYFNPVDLVPAHIARSVLNRMDLFQGGHPGNELPIRATDVPSVLDDFKITGIVPGEVLVGNFAEHDGLQALPWIARPVAPDLQHTINEVDVRAELLAKVSMETRQSIGTPELTRIFALSLRNRQPLVIVDALSPISNKDKLLHKAALSRSARELSKALFMLVEARQKVTLLSER